MYHDKTIYILKAYIEESVMGRVFFPGGAPPPLTGGGHCPPFFQKNCFSRKYIYSDREHSTESYEQKILKKFGPGGAQPPGGLLTPIFSKNFLLPNVSKTIYILNSAALNPLAASSGTLFCIPQCQAEFSLFGS